MNYPDNMPSPRRFMRTVECKNGHSWEAEFIEDFGEVGFFDIEDSDCPECGEEGIC